MKLSVFTVSTPDLTPEQLAAAAKQAGIDAIEWRYKEVADDALQEAPSFWRNNLCSISPFGDQAHLEGFKKAAEAHGLETLSVTPYLQAGDVEGTEKVLAAARQLGARFIRVGVPGYDRTKHVRELIELELSYLKEVAPLCKQYGIKGLLETHHGTIAASASATLRLCEGFDPDSIGVLYDPGNMVYEGFENYRMGMELLGPYLAHVHVKNAGWDVSGTTQDGSVIWKCGWKPLKGGVVPIAGMIEDLKAVGYEGYLGIEDFSNELPSKEMLQHFADYMRSLL
jgi:sugar phosphate isomerase/epimerase